MNLAAGYIAQTLQTHDEHIAARVNQQRRFAADRRADAAERAERAERAEHPGMLHRLAERLHLARTAPMRPAH